MIRPPSLAWAQLALAQLDRAGVRHVEIAWRPEQAGWISDGQTLRKAFPSIAFGAASVCSSDAVRAAASAGFDYIVSPVLDAELLAEAKAIGVMLVPGVMTPTEVYRARALGCPLVKLFPAAALGIHYWQQLRLPLGEPLPRCLAAGGLKAATALSWLAAGVDAVALGSALFRDEGGSPVINPDLAALMAALTRRSPPDAAA